jgi:5'-3' exonuclease
MGIKGLYSCLKRYALPIVFAEEIPSRLGLDAYPFFYKFREDVAACMNLFEKLIGAGHSLLVFLDGTPPKEKMEELANRRSQKETALTQAKALRSFLEDYGKSGDLDESARQILEKQISQYEAESWSLRKDVREKFLVECERRNIPVRFCKGEADNELIRASLCGEIDIVIANDMDLFVGGVERLWMLGKTHSDPLFLEFRRSLLSSRLGIHPQAWVDVAILTGYEKTPELKRGSPHQAIVWMRYYGCMERLFAKQPALLQKNTVEDFQKARSFFL